MLMHINRRSHAFAYYYPARTMPLSFAASTLIQSAIFMSVLAISDPNHICRAKGQLVFPGVSYQTAPVSVVDC